MSHSKAAENFTERFSHFADRFERWLKRAICILAALAVLSQAAMQVPAVRHFLSAADRLEGEAYRQSMQGSGR